MVLSRHNTLAWALIVAAGAALAGTAAAQDQPDRTMPLGGPAVKDRAVPGVAGSFGDNPDQKRKFQDRLSPKIFREAMGAVMGDDAPEDLRATSEQRAAIRAHMQAYQAQLKGYVQEHRQEIEDLRAKVPPQSMSGPAGELFRRIDMAAGTRGEHAGPRHGPDHPRPPADGGPEQGAGKARKAAQDIPVEVRDQLRELAAGLPPFEQVYTQVWSELNPDQQRAVDARLQEAKGRQAKAREDEYVNKRAKKKAGPGADSAAGSNDDQPNGPPPPRRRPGDGARTGPGVGPGAGGNGDRRERLNRLFEQMSPEQQEALLARIQRFRDQQGAGDPPALSGKLGRALARPGERRPMPPPDRVPVPPGAAGPGGGPDDPMNEPPSND